LLDTTERTVTVSHASVKATWALTLDSYAKSNVSNTTASGTPRALASDLIDDALNGHTPTIYGFRGPGDHPKRQDSICFRPTKSTPILPPLEKRDVNPGSNRAHDPRRFRHEHSRLGVVGTSRATRPGLHARP
jgi:hypothetical protein